MGRSYNFPPLELGECIAKKGSIPGLKVGDIIFMNIYFEENQRLLTQSYNEYASLKGLP